MDCVALIQARMSSSRLPGKVLRPLAGRAVLEHVVERCGAFARPVVCTSTDPSDDPIAQHCRRRGQLCIRGPLEDVFSRFRGALSDPRVAAGEWWIRVTADCPLVSASLARYCLDRAGEGVDYVAIRQETLPRGLSVEVVRRSSFEALDARELDGPQREHVTLALYEQPERFHCLWLDAPPSFQAPELRLTLDTPEDLALLTELFSDEPKLTAEAAIARLRRQPELAARNAHCQQKPARALQPPGGEAPPIRP